MKPTLEERKKKINASIEKEQANIAASKKKIRSFQQKLKEIEAEKDKRYAEKILQLVSDKGLSSDSQRKVFLKQLEQIDIPKAEPVSEENSDEPAQISAPLSPTSEEEKLSTNPNFSTNFSSGYDTKY